MKMFRNLFVMAGAALMIAGCEADNSKFPIPLDEVIDSNGGFLRIITNPPGAFDAGSISTQAFTVTLEADDKRNGALLKEVRLFATFTEASDASLNKGRTQIKTFAPTDFPKSTQTNLPRADISVPLAEILGTLGLAADSLSTNDSFLFQWELELTDGQIFDENNSDGNITGGAFYNSPFRWQTNVAFGIPSNRFVGAYTITYGAENGIGDDLGVGLALGDDGSTITLSVSTTNPLNGRQFTYVPYSFPGLASRVFQINFVKFVGAANETFVPTQPTGLGCGGAGLQIAQRGTSGTFTSENDDATFTLSMWDDFRSSCDAPYPMDVTFTKQ